VSIHTQWAIAFALYSAMLLTAGILIGSLYQERKQQERRARLRPDVMANRYYCERPLVRYQRDREGGAK
jgi:hypothetical protein